MTVFSVFCKITQNDWKKFSAIPSRIQLISLDTVPVIDLETAPSTIVALSNHPKRPKISWESFLKILKENTQRNIPEILGRKSNGTEISGRGFLKIWLYLEYLFHSSLEISKIQTKIFIEWKVPLVSLATSPYR